MYGFVKTPLYIVIFQYLSLSCHDPVNKTPHKRSLLVTGATGSTIVNKQRPNIGSVSKLTHGGYKSIYNEMARA